MLRVILYRSDCARIDRSTLEDTERLRLSVLPHVHQQRSRHLGMVDKGSQERAPLIVVVDQIEPATVRNAPG